MAVRIAPINSRRIAHTPGVSFARLAQSRQPARQGGKGWQSGPVETLFLLSGAVRRDAGVEAWFAAADQEMRRLAQPWFEAIRACGPDVRELLHDFHPTACVGEAAFAYVDAFAAHV